MYARLRSYHGGFGSVSLSEFASTIRATSGPNSVAIRSSIGAAAAVLDGVVQQRADRLGLAAAHLEHERGDAEQVGDVRDARALAQLPAMVLGREQQRAIEALAEDGLVRVGLWHPFTLALRACGGAASGRPCGARSRGSRRGGGDDFARREVEAVA